MSLDGPIDFSPIQFAISEQERKRERERIFGRILEVSFFLYRSGIERWDEMRWGIFRIRIRIVRVAVVVVFFFFSFSFFLSFFMICIHNYTHNYTTSQLYTRLHTQLYTQQRHHHQTLSSLLHIHRNGATITIIWNPHHRINNLRAQWNHRFPNHAWLWLERRNARLA